MTSPLPPSTSDSRRQALADWLGQALGGAPFELSVASADASFRRYFRVHLGAAETLIAMDSPPAHEDVRPWLAVARLIEGAGVHAPHVHAEDVEQGFLLLGDLGAATYQDALAAGHDPAPLYRDALIALARLQGRIATGQGGGAALPRYDRALLHRELELFREWLCLRHLGLELSSAEHGVLDRAFRWLEDEALAMPVAFVHRDWHARNLMACPGSNPGVLDFQDAVVGPVAYDLVSLTRDAYLSWSPARIAGWIADFHHEARAERAPVPDSLAEFTRQHDLIGVQRHLKVAGIFARLALRDGKRRYLDDVPRVLGHLLEVLPEHAALRELDHFTRERVAPAFAVAAREPGA